MDMKQAIAERHSVRQYLNKPIEGETLAALQKAVADCNAQSGLHIQLVANEPKAFDSFLSHYGKFSGVTNYFALIGKKGDGLEEACGYYGEKLVLLAQTLGLRTCWAGGSYQKVPSAYTVGPGEKLTLVIAVGYGATDGHPRKSKTYEQVAKTDAAPEWFRRGVEAALLAPTAINQQKFTFTLRGDKVKTKAGFGPFAKTDLGIVKCHFEIGAGKDRGVWEG
jgi:nitroreductase